MTFSGSRLPRARPTTMASASAATMPSVDPSHVPNQPWSVARVMVASMVLSPSSARKNAVPTAMTARLPARLTFSCSSSVRVSPRSVQTPKATNARAATRLIQPVGSAAPSPKPIATDTRCTIAVATVMPTSTGHTLKRVAKVNAMSWDLSPSSATKMTPNARSVLARTASTGRYGPLSSVPGRGARTSTRHIAAWIEGLARLEDQAARPDVRRITGVGQCVDRDIGGYSPSLRLILAATAPRHTVTSVSRRVSRIRPRAVRRPARAPAPAARPAGWSPTARARPRCRRGRGRPAPRARPGGRPPRARPARCSRRRSGPLRGRESGMPWPAPRSGRVRGRHGDPVLADLAVDRRSRHRQPAGRLDLVAAGVDQRLDDGVALQRLQRGEHALAGDPALRRQVADPDHAG